MDDPNAGAVLRAAMALTAFGQGGGVPGDVDDDATLTLLSQRPMMFQDSEVEMQVRVGALGTAVDDDVDHDLPPECAKMLPDIVFRTHLDVFCRALLGYPPARMEPMTVRLQPGARAVRAKPRASPIGAPTSKAVAQRLQGWRVFLGQFPYTIVHIAGDENCWADLLSRWVRPEGPVCVHASGGAFRWKRQVSDEGRCARRAGGRCGGRTHP